MTKSENIPSQYLTFPSWRIIIKCPIESRLLAYWSHIDAHESQKVRFKELALYNPTYNRLMYVIWLKWNNLKCIKKVLYKNSLSILNYHCPTYLFSGSGHYRDNVPYTDHRTNYIYSNEYVWCRLVLINSIKRYYWK